MKKLFKKAKRNIIAYVSHYLPRKYTRRMIMATLKLETNIPEEYVFCVARTKSELEQAYSILHDCYVSEGYMLKHPTGMRVTPYHALPSTTTLIVKHKGDVVATVSIIKEGILGFPSDKIIKADDILLSGERIGEISSLAIRKDFQSRSGTILMPLIKYLMEYGRSYFNLDYYIIAYHPKWNAFYQSIFGFNKINFETCDEYDFANGNAADVAVLDLKNLDYNLAHFYYDFPDEKSVFHYFFRTKIKQFKFPSRTINRKFDSSISKENFEYFFHKDQDVSFRLAGLKKHFWDAISESWPQNSMEATAREIAWPIPYSHGPFEDISVDLPLKIYTSQSNSSSYPL
jgi:hypothetical protein